MLSVAHKHVCTHTPTLALTHTRTQTHTPLKHKQPHVKPHTHTHWVMCPTVHPYVSYAFSLKSPQALGHKTVVVSGLLTSAKKIKELKEPTLHVSEKDSKRT